jgi:hypothetical protein
LSVSSPNKKFIPDFCHCPSGIHRQPVGSAPLIEANGLAGLLLADCSPLGCLAVWSDILDLQSQYITGAELAIDCQAKHCKIATAAFGL